MNCSSSLSLGILETRRRFSGILNKRSGYKSNKSKNFDKAITRDRCSSWKPRLLKLAFGLVLCGCFLTLIQIPAAFESKVPQDYVYRSRFVDVGWLWGRGTITPYASPVDVEWSHIQNGMERLGAVEDPLAIGLLNFNSNEISNWKELIPHAEYSIVHLERADGSITWDTLYPEWIDEEEEFEIPKCPTLPHPSVSKKAGFDLIAVKLPCKKESTDWSRDVARLHLQLSAAKLAASSREDRRPVHVLFLSECFPIPNLFRCKDLVSREGNIWLYKPEISALREKLQLPIGSCKLAVPFKATRMFYSGAPHREAYATILHSAHVYVCGAIAAAQSIRMAGSTRDLVILVDETISDHHRGGLEAAGWKVRIIQRIRNPKAERDAYNEWNYSKFRLWQLTDYDKIIFIDADLLILRNIDFLFAMPEITATGNNATLFNSGVMMVEPSNCTFQLLMDHINEIESYNGGDQGYLNEIFTWWHRIPKHMNFLKHFWIGDEEEKKQKKIQLFSADPPILYVLHYLGMKPWLCFRDYDCNWNNNILHEFASDVAHRTWWKVHDAMPSNLQYFCLLRSKQKAALEWDRRQAEKENYTNGYWKRKIKDERLTTCFENFCFWESMLWHWGETNWTDSSSPPPPAISAPNGSFSL